MKRRKRLLTVEITVWDEGSTVKYRPGIPDNKQSERAMAMIEAAISQLRRAIR